MSTPSYFLIKSKLNGLVLDIAGGNPAPRTPIVLYTASNGANQQWTINEQGVIVSKLNGFALDGSQPYNVAVTNPATGAATQQWIITDQGVVINQANGFALEVLGGSSDLFTPVIVSPVKDGDLSQQWELVPVPEEVPPPVLPTDCEALANSLKSCLPQFTDVVSQTTTNDLDVTGTSLTSTVNGKADTVDLTGAVATILKSGNADITKGLKQATTNTLALSGSNLTSTVNGNASSVDLAPVIASVTNKQQRLWYSKLTNSTTTKSTDYTDISTLSPLTITLNSPSKVLITLNCPDTWMNTKGLRAWFKIKVATQAGQEQSSATGLYTSPETDYRVPITVSTVVELAAGTYVITPQWHVDANGEASIGSQTTILTAQVV
ncbi:hypothetical protein NUACC21_73410 [Scytonema sp. NUACC21]